MNSCRNNYEQNFYIFKVVIMKNLHAKRPLMRYVVRKMSTPPRKSTSPLPSAPNAPCESPQLPPVPTPWRIVQSPTYIFGKSYYIRPWQFKFSVMYVHILVFYIICLLTYFHIKMSECAKKKCFTCIPRKREPFWQLSWLDNFITNAIANLFIHERPKIPEVCSETSQTSKNGMCAKIINN